MEHTFKDMVVVRVCVAVCIYAAFHLLLVNRPHRITACGLTERVQL